MTVRIGTGSAAVDPSALLVAGVAPSKIMLGTGTGAVEVWAARYVATITGPAVSATSSTSLSLVLSHTVTGGGLSVVSGGGTWSNPVFTRRVQVRVNGVVVADESTSTNDFHPVAVAAERMLLPGDLVELWARHSSTSSGARILSPRLTFS